jgi:phage gpG-like protein
MLTFAGTVDSGSVDRALEDFQAELADNSQALAEVADGLRQQIAEQFATEGAAGSTPWAPLAPSTLGKSRRRLGGILYSTGALFESLTDPRAPGHVEQVSAKELLFGSALPYAAYHQTGTGIGRGRLQVNTSSRKPRKSAGRGKSSGPGRGRALPMRPMIIVNEARVAGWMEIVRTQIEAKSPLLGAEEMG